MGDPLRPRTSPSSLRRAWGLGPSDIDDIEYNAPLLGRAQVLKTLNQHLLNHVRSTASQLQRQATLRESSQAPEARLQPPITVRLTGAAGLGKRRLLREFQRSALLKGAFVLDMDMRPLPAQPYALLRSLAEQFKSLGARSHPDLRDLAATLNEVLDILGHGHSFREFKNQVQRLVDQIIGVADQRLLLVCAQDVHLAGERDVHFLLMLHRSLIGARRRLIRRRHGPAYGPQALIVASADESVMFPWTRGFWKDLEREPELLTLELQALSADDSLEWVRQQLQDRQPTLKNLNRRDFERLWKACEGRLFLIREWLDLFNDNELFAQSLRGECWQLTEVCQILLDDQLEFSPEEMRSLVADLAYLGGGAFLETLCELGLYDQESILPELEVLEVRGFLTIDFVQDEVFVRFQHPAWKRVVEILEPDLKVGHGRIFSRFDVSKDDVDGLLTSTQHAIMAGRCAPLNKLLQLAETLVERQAYQTASKVYERLAERLDEIDPSIAEEAHEAAALNLPTPEGQEPPAEDSMEDSDSVLARDLGVKRRFFGLYSQICAKLGQFDKARELAFEETKICRRLGDQKAQAEAMARLGQWNVKVRSYEDARNQLFESLKVARSMNWVTGMTQSLLALGELSLAKGRCQKAFDYFQECTKLCKSLDPNSPKIPVYLRAMARAQLRRKYIEEARSLASQAALWEERQENSEGLAETRDLLTDIALRNQQPEKALREAQSALELWTGLGENAAIVRARTVLATVYFELGQRAEGLSQLEAGMDWAQQHGLKEHLAQASHEWAQRALEDGDFERALPMFQEALAMWTAQEDWAGVVLGASSLARYFQQVGRLDRAETCFDAATRVVNKVPKSLFRIELELLYSQSWQHYCRGRLSKARLTMERVLRRAVHKKSPEWKQFAQASLANILVDLSEHRNALRFLADLDLEDFPESQRRLQLTVRLLVIQAYLSLDQWLEAQHHLDIARAELETHGSLQQRLRWQRLHADCLRQCGQYQDCGAVLAEAKDQQPELWAANFRESSEARLVEMRAMLDQLRLDSQFYPGSRRRISESSRVFAKHCQDSLALLITQARRFGFELVAARSELYLAELGLLTRPIQDERARLSDCVALTGAYPRLNREALLLALEASSLESGDALINDWDLSAHADDSALQALRRSQLEACLATRANQAERACLILDQARFRLEEQLFSALTRSQRQTFGPLRNLKVQRKATAVIPERKRARAWPVLGMNTELMSLSRLVHKREFLESLKVLLFKFFGLQAAPHFDWQPSSSNATLAPFLQASWASQRLQVLDKSRILLPLTTPHCQRLVLELNDPRVQSLDADSQEALLPELEALQGVLHRLFEHRQQREQIQELEQALKAAEANQETGTKKARASEQVAETPPFLFGSHPSMKTAQTVFESVSRTACPVWIMGPKGSGKSHLARVLLEAWRGRAGPERILCAQSMSESFFEERLFGAQSWGHRGALEPFLIENITSLSLRSQRRFVEAFDEWHGPLGVITTSRESLDRAVKQGRFRQDLAHRLNVVRIKLPPLKDRIADLPDLVESFKLRELRFHGLAIDHGLLESFRARRWTGNLAELEEVLRANLLEGLQSVSGAAEGSSAAPVNLDRSLKDTLADIEKRYLREMLEKCQNNKSKAAKMLGMSRYGFLKKLDKHGLRKPKSKAGPSNTENVNESSDVSA